MAAFLLVFYYWQLGTNRYYDPETYEPLPSLECLEKPDMNKHWLNIMDFRQIEFVVFFSQILSLLIHILICKFYLWMKQKLLSDEELDELENKDPFYDLLRNGTNDFLASDNKIMIINTVQIVNFMFSLYGVLDKWIKDNE